MLAIPTYNIQNDKKSGVLMNPKFVTDVGKWKPLSAKVCGLRRPCPWLGPSNYVSTKDLQDLVDKWAEHFACFEKLLTRGNIFSPLKVAVPGSPAKKPPVSDKPFLEPTSP